MLRPTILAITVAGLLPLIGIRFLVGQSQRLPSFTKADATSEERVAAFVDAFFNRDPQARQLLNPSNRTLFAAGYRPDIGVPHNPEASGTQFGDILPYFVRKLFLDLKALERLDRKTLESFIDQVGRWADETIMCAGEITGKYNLAVDGPFNFDQEVQKVPVGPERERFKHCWLNDFVLGTELRLLAWIYQQLFGVSYVNPEKRK